VSFSYETEDGYALGKWVDKQRQRKSKLSKSRIRKLESLKIWVWNKNIADWEEGFQQLLIYGEENGHYLVSRGYKTKDGYNLSSWVNNQRGRKRTLSSNRIKKLKSVKGWVWNVNEEQWERGYAYMVEYSKKEGNCLVPVNKITEDGYTLGRWVNKQRTRKKTMSKDRQKRLEDISGWVWAARKK